MKRTIWIPVLISTAVFGLAGQAPMIATKGKLTFVFLEKQLPHLLAPAHLSDAIRSANFPALLKCVNLSSLLRWANLSSLSARGAGTIAIGAGLIGIGVIAGILATARGRVPAVARVPMQQLPTAALARRRRLAQDGIRMTTPSVRERRARRGGRIFRPEGFAAPQREDGGDRPVAKVETRQHLAAQLASTTGAVRPLLR